MHMHLLSCFCFISLFLLDKSPILPFCLTTSVIGCLSSVIGLGVSVDVVMNTYIHFLFFFYLGLFGRLRPLQDREG